ncbi:hypothetical protein V5O48_006639 [Marasmius crinis-equi]|uniref:Erythromycin biosynthesis protein CIII-like C-terminal domain-containing protein n=1 Tax=Marasmius crinis-equi TaxID=585013 RepID=A0ABR3FJJ6_9AGAR
MSSDQTSSGKILVFAYSDYGQANPMLSIVYELALMRPEVELHVASFTPLDTRLPDFQALLDRDRKRRAHPTHNIKDIVFHHCKGVTNMQAFGLYNGGMHAMTHPSGIRGCFKATENLDYLAAPLEAEGYLESFFQCREMITTMNPDIVIVDSLFKPAIDACRESTQLFVVLSTMSYKECTTADQPVLSLLTRFPAYGSGYPYPVPWHLIPSNVFINLLFGYTFATNPRFKKLDAYRKEHAGLNFGFHDFVIPGVQYLCPSLPETDFPFFVPDHIFSCGPLIFPFVPVEEADPELGIWIDKGPTILVNLGSHAISDEGYVTELAKGLRIMFASGGVPSHTQVLWKVKLGGGDSQIRNVIEGIIGAEIQEDRVKLVDWLKADPVSILLHPNTACTVHHGGANSFNEGIWAGVPHIVLPVWYDTYDFASRVEYLGIGIYGSKACSPGVEAEEFGKALLRIVGSEAQQYKGKAGSLGDACRARGNGRELGAKRVLELAGL